MDAENRLLPATPDSAAIFATATADVAEYLGYPSAAAFEAATPEDRETRLKARG